MVISSPQLQDSLTPGIHLLNESRMVTHGQKESFRKAMQQLESLRCRANHGLCVTIGDVVSTRDEDGILKGHGTMDRSGDVVASLSGVVERVNKLVCVRALRSRYKPEIGDVIVGRVVEVVPKRWKLDINFCHDAVLMLSSMNLPDGIQRRRTALDELNMRRFFEEDDVICAEVRNFQNDGNVQLQARTQKYGKLNKGQLVVVPSYIVKKQRHHFHHIEPHGIDLILGCNGFIWIGQHVDARDTLLADQIDGTDTCARHDQGCEEIPVETRQAITRVANAIRALSGLGFTLTLEAVMDTFNLSVSLNLGIHELLDPEFSVLVAESEVERRSSASNRKR